MDASKKIADDTHTAPLRLFQVEVEVLPQSIKPDAAADMDYADACLAHEALVDAMGELGYVRQIHETVSDEASPKKLQHWRVLGKSVEDAEAITKGTPLGRDGYMKIHKAYPIQESYAPESSRNTQPYPRPGNMLEILLRRISFNEAVKYLDDFEGLRSSPNN